jgi:hypothetical protein
MPRAATFMYEEGNGARVAENLTDISDEDDWLPEGVAPLGALFPADEGPSSTRCLDSCPKDGYPAI